MNYEIAILVWIACGIGCFLIAQSRHATNAPTWFLVGIVFGPLGIVLAVIGAKGKTDPSAGAADQLARLQAARDGGLLTPEQYQAQAASLAMSTIGPPTNTAGPNMKCGRCGKPLSPAWVGKCLHCKASYAEFPPVPRTS